MNWGQVGLSGVTGGVGGVVGKVAADAIGSAAADAMEKLIPGTCFAAGTPVQTADGSTRPIEEVKAGDWVWGRDEVSGQAQAHQVRQTIQREAPATLTLAFDGGQTLTTTPEHPFWAVGRGWSPARELGIGTSIVTRAGPSVRVASITRHEAPAPVYNFEVEGTHSYFVGHLGQGICVHDGPCPFTEEQGIVIQWAKEYGKRGGISRPDAIALVDLAQQAGLNAHGPEIHPNRAPKWSGLNWHLHVGDCVDHLPVH